MNLRTRKRVGAKKTDVVLIFLSSVILMRLCAAHRRRILLKNIIFDKWNQSF